MSEWISVKDRLPEPERDVLVLMSDGVIIAHLDKDFPGNMFFGWNGGAFGCAPYVTHWMPLPAPPEVK